MDFLNNIWSAISTPNDGLIKIASIIILFLIEMPLSFSLIVNVFNLQYNKKQQFTYIILTSLIFQLTLMFTSWPINTLINYTSSFIILYILFRKSILKTFIATIFPSIIFNLSGLLCARHYLSLLNITYDQTNTIFIYRIPFAFITYFLVFIFLLVIKYRQIVLNIFDNLDKNNKIIIMTNFIFGTFCILMQSFLSTKYIDILPISFSLFNFICLLIYFVLSFFTLTKVSKLVLITEKLESSEAYNKSLHILHDSVRGFKHDFDNIVTTIGGYVKTEDMEGLKNYYSQLESDCSKVNNLYILNPNIINNPGIYNLLTAKYGKAEEKEIRVNLTFLLDLDNLQMKIYDFARILGILLDNAIESAEECSIKELNIIFRNEVKNKRNIVLIENTYNDKNIDLNKIFEKGFSGKTNHSGIGLWKINQILKKNNNINLHTSKNDKYFSQQLEIYY